MGSDRFATDEARWHAVSARETGADGEFFFAVSSTGVYCYPSCSARRPRRDNVRFYATRAAAEAAGYRPCKRCRPDLATPAERQAAMVARACAALEAHEEPTLAQLAAAAELSPHHFQRVFKRCTGLTPKRYAQAHRAGRLREALAAGGRVTDAIYAAGYGSGSRVYERADALLGMSAGAYARGGVQQRVRFCVTDCWLGKMLVAATDVGVCAILFGSNERELSRELERRFPNAQRQRAADDSRFVASVARVVAYVDTPDGEFPLPLDIHGTAFQERVWAALREIPCGSTASYAEVAQAIGQPRATRAVAGACAANPVAVAVPCHRVVRSDGKLSGYRWGAERKRALLRRERALAPSERASTRER